MTKVPADFGQNVFLNCPFDQDYKPLFEAAIFTVRIAGLTPRCALEANNAGRARLEKIMDIISECRFGIHDISRTELGPGKLPRFNMPLELGLDLGCSRWGSRRLIEKRLLIMDRSLWRYQRSISDLAGPQDRTSSTMQMIRANWCAKSATGSPPSLREALSREAPTSIRSTVCFESASRGCAGR